MKMDELLQALGLLLSGAAIYAIASHTSGCGKTSTSFVQEKIIGWNKREVPPSPKELEQFWKDSIPILRAYAINPLGIHALTGKTFNMVALRVYDLPKFLSNCQKLGVQKEALETPKYRVTSERIGWICFLFRYPARHRIVGHHYSEFLDAELFGDYENTIVPPGSVGKGKRVYTATWIRSPQTTKYAVLPDAIVEQFIREEEQLPEVEKKLKPYLQQMSEPLRDYFYGLIARAKVSNKIIRLA